MTPTSSLALKHLQILQLIRTPGIGPKTFYKLLKAHHDLPDALATVAQKKPLPSKESLQKEMAALEKYGAHLIAFDAPGYPPLLKTIDDAPPLIFAKGNLNILTKPMVGVVGGRNAGLHSQELTKRLTYTLGQNGIITCSGFARGIDIAAHRGAHATGSVAVFAGGLDHIFPPEHAKELPRFLEKGVILSEMPLGTAPQQALFPRRNRLISGMSQGIVVVDAGIKSGSMITADYALAQGREIFAVPGSPIDSRCRGSNKLIKEGAILVENGWDVLQHLKMDPAFTPSSLDPKALEPTTATSQENMSTLEKRILEGLSTVPVDMQTLAHHLNISPQALRQHVTEMELAGKIMRNPGDQLSLPLSHSPA